MNLLPIMLTDAATSTTGVSGWYLVFYLVFFGVIMYFMIFRPQKKQQQKQTELVNSIEIGDSVLTTSGFYGVVIDMVDEDVMIVEFGNNKNCRIPMKKSAIEQIEKADAE